MKKYKSILLVFALTLGILGYLSYVHNVHPYGFNIDVPEENVVEIKQGVINTQTHIIDATEVNPIPVMLAIDSFTQNWMRFLLVISLFVAGLLGFFKSEHRGNLKLRTYALIYFPLLLVSSISGILFFSNQATDIVSLLTELDR